MRPGLIRALCAAAVVAGILLRFDGLARRPLWYDEAATVLHLGGRTEAGIRTWYDGRPLRRADLLGPAAGPAAAVRAARADEPQSGPAYFACAAVWRAIAGDSLAALRALSAAASVLALGATALLAYRLGGGADRALAVAALVALSPLHLRYAEEARPYALWSLALPVAMLAVLRATRFEPLAGRRAWVAPVVAVTAALAVHPFTLLALPAIVALAPGPRVLAASGMAVSLWAMGSVPAWLDGAAMGRTTAWVGDGPGIPALVRAWLGIVTSVFFRPAGEGGLLGAAAASPGGRIVWALLGIGAALVTAVALRTVGGAPGRARRVVRRLALVPWAVLALVDVVRGGRRSTVARYLVPSWLGCELAVGELGGRAGRAAVLAVLGLAALTAVRTRGVDAWWDTDPPRVRALAAIAAAVRGRVDPIVLSDAAPTAIAELAYALDDGVELRLGGAAPARVPAGEWERVVVVLASPELLAAVRRSAGVDRTLVPLGPDAAGYAIVRARP